MPDALVLYGAGRYPREEMLLLVEPFSGRYKTEVYAHGGNGADGGFTDVKLVLSAVGIATATGWLIKPFLEEAAKEFARRFAAFAEKHWPTPRRPDQYLAIRLMKSTDAPADASPSIDIEVKTDLTSANIDQVLSDVERVWRRVSLAIAAGDLNTVDVDFCASQDSGGVSSRVEARGFPREGPHKLVAYEAILDDGDGPLPWIETIHPLSPK